MRKQKKKHNTFPTSKKSKQPESEAVLLAARPLNSEDFFSEVDEKIRNWDIPKKQISRDFYRKLIT